jgi:hypothetical protein
MVTAILVVVLSVVVLMAYLLAQPSDFRIVRSLLINAPAQDLYGMAADLRNFNTWNPFALQDPQLKLTYSGANAGTGAAYNWEGPKTGVGRMEIISAEPSRLVTMKLDFSKPFEAHNTVDFTFQAVGSQTNVTWEMRGTRNFMMKAMGLFFSMDRVVGGEFEKGLATLKTISERK